MGSRIHRRLQHRCFYSICSLVFHHVPWKLAVKFLNKFFAVPTEQPIPTNIAFPGANRSSPAVPAAIFDQILIFKYQVKQADMKEPCFRCKRPTYFNDKVGPLKDGTLFHKGKSRPLNSNLLYPFFRLLQMLDLWKVSESAEVNFSIESNSLQSSCIGHLLQ